MHGLILVSLRDYLSAAHGPGTARQVMGEEPAYTLSQAYPDERLTALVERAAGLTGLEQEVLLRDFGIFTAETTFAKLYPALFAVSSSARPFLLTVERPIHEVVRAAIPNARPPQLAISELGGDGVLIVYDSPRRLCNFLRGLVEGVARHYDERADIDEQTCMHRGDPNCTFAIRFEADS